MAAMFRTARRPSNNQSKEISILKKDKKIIIYRRRGTIIIVRFREASKCENFELWSRDAKHIIGADLV
jgi:bifunctional DNA-binding transcriptional regulator/antitoxin component of YhaV-PrlF toxin-antitoxin module